MAELIKKVLISNYRSIGEVPVTVVLEKKINILAGPNNSGKSNAIHALEYMDRWKEHFEKQANAPKLQAVDYHKLENANQPSIGIVLDNESLGLLGLAEDDVEGEIYITYSVVNNILKPKESFLDNLKLDPFNKLLGKYQNRKLGASNFHIERGGQSETILATPGFLRDIFTHLRSVKTIPQFRQIGSSNTENALAGKGIIGSLAIWQIPDIGRDSDRERFDSIQDLLRRLLHEPNAILEIPPGNNKIIVNNNGLRLPLESYGTGVHELIIIAAALFRYDEVLFCIEEPEIHLHPKLQREFLRFLQEETGNRYVLSTHSNVFLSPGEDIQIVHLWNDKGVTRSRLVESSVDTLKILTDLGVKASDLLQANSVIWVEGPSDRIFLKRWIELLWPNLREGIDYSIMFYGGKLLSHISMERDTVDEEAMESFVELLRISQNSVIVIDSDREKKGGQLNKTKRRIRKECEKNNIFCWITHGREIENYIPPSAIIRGYSKQGVDIAGFSIGDFDKVNELIEKNCSVIYPVTKRYENNKPKMARIIAPLIQESEISKELRQSLDGLYATIIPKE